MTNIEDILISKNTPIFEVLDIINKSSKQLALVVDEQKKLLGTVSDGDIRRALLQKVSLDESIENIYFQSPTVANVNDSKEDIINLCSIKKLRQIPIIDSSGTLVGLEILDELICKDKKSNKVILMVGGLGSRLKPLTNSTPKPMLNVGDKPILHTIVEKFAYYGFVNIIMCIGYKAHVIKDYFKDGSDFGVNIEYILEDKKMGTAGALSLLNSKLEPTESFFVMNGDILTNVNFEHLLNFHKKNDADATMCVREYDFQVPYGVVNLHKNSIVSIEEKPIYEFFVSAGIYMLEPNLLKYIPKDSFFDMPTLFEKLITESKRLVSFPIKEYWIDIGGMEEFKKANNEKNLLSGSKND
jgi:dTDP-glucose pyrophosphorylase/predicted transcriptional regulator